jgi:hypothetical protein
VSVPVVVLLTGVLPGPPGQLMLIVTARELESNLTLATAAGPWTNWSTS